MTKWRYCEIAVVLRKVEDHHKLRWLRDIAGHDLPADLTARDADYILIALGMGLLRPQASIFEGMILKRAMRELFMAYSFG